MEKIFVKMEGEDIVFKVEESHREVLINNNFYNVSISPYEFTIIKNESLLNDTWVENESMILEYSPVYSATQLANSYSNSTFTFKVVEIDEPKFVGNTDYSNTCTIEMVYNIEGFEDLKRSYTFARDFGLISFTVGDNEIAIN